MRVIILNMMILGAMSCLVENDVFARYNKFADRIRVTESGDLVGEEDFSDSFNRLFSTNETKSEKKETESTESTVRQKTVQRDVAKVTLPPIQVGSEIESLPLQKENISSPTRIMQEDNASVLPPPTTDIVKIASDKRTASSRLLVEDTGSALSRQQPVQRDDANASPPPSSAMVGNANVPPPPSPAMTGNANIPPPPSAQGGNAVPLPPPPPPMSGMVIKCDASDLVEGLRKKLNELLTSDGVIPMANILNFYLQGNKEIISEGMEFAGDSATSLVNRLDNELKILDKMFAGNHTVKEFCDLLKSLRDPLKRLTKQSYYAISSNRGDFFREISQKIKETAASYFSKFMESGENLKSIPNLMSALKEADIVMERAVVLSNSFSNLANLSEMPRLEEFSERATLDALEIIKLKRFFKANVESLNGTVTLPTGNAVTEKKVVEKALEYIEETLNGNNQLPALLDMRDVLNNKYTVIATKEKDDKVRFSPLNVIRRLSDRMGQVGILIGKAGKAGRNGDYSQFGKMFKEADGAYGAALIPSVNKWVNSEEFAEFNIAQINSELGRKKLTGNIIGEYIKLLTEDKALCSKSFADSIINKMNSQAKFKSSAYASMIKPQKQESQQKTEQKKEDHLFLLEIVSVDGKTKLGTFSDPNKKQNMIAFSSLKKNCEEYIKGMSSIDEDIREIPEMLKKSEKILSAKITDKGFAEYVNNILKEYFVFEGFVTSGDRINLKVVNTKDGLLSEKDVPNVVFALAQNCGLAVKQPASPLLSTSKDTDNLWVFNMARNLHVITSETINAILDSYTRIFPGNNGIKGTEVEGIFEKLNNLRKSIKNVMYQNEVLENVVQGLNISVSKAKADAKTEAEKVPAEKIDEMKLRKMADNAQNLSKLADDVSDLYAQNSQSDNGKLQKIKADIGEVIFLVKTASDKKAKTKQNNGKRNAGFVR